jgi:hypothetical protein
MDQHPVGGQAGGPEDVAHIAWDRVGWGGRTEIALMGTDHDHDCKGWWRTQDELAH